MLCIKINCIHKIIITGEIKVFLTNQIKEIPAIRILLMSKKYHKFVGNVLRQYKYDLEKGYCFIHLNLG
ncbi:hypothetical protein BK774_26495 [Bacillus thuringiensis]|uniref:Uncharacterized protein n=1 Tax=Bacillus thuringiensis TaxID=1428 RepID=A0A9X6K8T4_BACTU|nr:hypothetical protein BK759_10370 [Bacillus thuringiensis serovar aizawai]OTZ97180.1 hypothetical protein BK774_26495 [Bacillus thuringiensis]